MPAERGCALSILAPAEDYDKSMDTQRTEAAQLIALMNDYWQDSLPGQVGRYNDDFEPRAFGDNFQRWGTRTILIESGGLAGDPEKQRIRRQNLLGLLAGLHGIATGAYATYDLQAYWDIPENHYNGMHELLLENVGLPLADSTYRTDVGIRLQETTAGPDYREFSVRATVSDIGDLSPFGAFRRFDATGLTARAPTPLRIGATAKLQLVDSLGTVRFIVDEGKLKSAGASGRGRR
jgi:hypothetical protein